MKTDPQQQNLVQELENANAELKRQLEQYQTIFDSTPIMFWYKDTKNVHIHVNKAAAALEGLPVTSIVGKSAYDLYPEAQAKAFHEDDLEVVRSGKPKLNIIDEHTSPATGKTMYLQTGKVPFRNKDDDVIGVVAFAVDITNQKTAEQEVQKAHDKLETQNQTLQRVNEFFLSTLDQMTEAVGRGADKGELLNYLKQAREQFERMEKAVQDAEATPTP